VACAPLIAWQVAAELEADGGRLSLRASGRSLAVSGYLAAYDDASPSLDGDTVS
jgi:hypothetical protein